MRISVLFFILYSTLSFSQQAAGEYSTRIPGKHEIIKCPHTGHNDGNPVYIPRLASTKKNNKKSVEFIPNYVDVPSTFRNTVEFVFDLLSDFVSTDVPIYVNVRYADLGGRDSGGVILASATTGQFYTNFPGAEYINTLYPIALAEKLSGQEINEPGEPDIFVNINSNRDANFSVSPNSPVIGSRIDLATTLVHEIIHGMGFIAGANIDAEGRGTLLPTIYARFMEDRDGINYLDSYPNNSIELGDEFTSSNVFFDGPRFSTTEPAELHAPGGFTVASSISHLDLRTYNDTQSRLMSPTATAGDIIYDPGIAREMLHDMGWFTTNFVHDSERFNEDSSEDYTIRAKVRTDSRVDESTVVMHYSRDTFQNEDIVVSLPKDETAGDFFFTLPAANTFTVFQYYFEVQDDSLGLITTPIRAPDAYFQYIMGEDTEGPEILGHIPVTSIRETDTQFSLTVNEFQDFFTGVDTSSLAVVVNLNGQLDTIPFELMIDGFGEFYEVDVLNEFSATDELGYKIILLDKSLNQNEGQLPTEGGFYTVAIEEVAAAIITYTNNFNAPDSDFQGTGFSIEQPEGFESSAIHTTHPYPTAGTGTLDFTYELSQLILIDSINPVIIFDEIVIVEPGDAGTVCNGINCTFQFWDYVVVEGKRSGDTEWQPFLDAYDCRERTIWRNAYNANEDGTPSLFRSKTIDLTENGNFNIGDEVFIRFRLFSDPAANGWGWAVDNLEIQPVEMTTSTLDQTILDQFIVSPNPAKAEESVSIDLSFSSEFNGLLTLVNTSGQSLLEKQILRQFRHSSKLDISGLTPGVYYLRLSNQTGVSTRKLVID